MCTCMYEVQADACMLTCLVGTTGRAVDLVGRVLDFVLGTTAGLLGGIVLMGGRND